MNEKIKQELIEEFITICDDLWPYNSSTYDEDLMKAAESYANEMMDPNSEIRKLMKDHDKLLEELKES